jgi:phosphodiesterase/alkaline phosphatase D-like protein
LWGNLAEFSLLDGRQHRTDQPFGDGEFPRCPESLDPSVTMLGEPQERWLKRNLDRSRARWNVIAHGPHPEFVGTSISSNGDIPVYGPYYGPMIPANPHIKFFDGDRRGYVRCQLDRDRWRTDLRV